MSKEIEKLDVWHGNYHPDDVEPAKTLAWALDMIEAYEGRLIQLGDPEHLVRSDIQKNTISRAKRILSELRMGSDGRRMERALVEICRNTKPTNTEKGKE